MRIKKACFAAGCFWGVQHILDQVDGVIETECGYTGGHTENPDYRSVCTGSTGHAEVVLVTYDETQLSFESLLDYFWRLHNPTTLNAQGPDVGSQYRSAIFYFDENQKNIALESIREHNSKLTFSKPIVTQVEPMTAYYKAEEYHQKYFVKNGHSGCHVLRPTFDLRSEYE